MDSARFAALADAFGGAILRWPTSERTGALLFALGHPNTAWRILKAATVIDRLLKHSSTPAFQIALAERIERIAIGRNSAAITKSILTPGFLTTGLAIAATAGVVAGLAFAPLVVQIGAGAIAYDPVADAAIAIGEPNELGEI